MKAPSAGGVDAILERLDLVGDRHHQLATDIGAVGVEGRAGDQVHLLVGEPCRHQPLDRVALRTLRVPFDRRYVRIGLEEAVEYLLLDLLLLVRRLPRRELVERRAAENFERDPSASSDARSGHQAKAKKARGDSQEHRAAPN